MIVKRQRGLSRRTVLRGMLGGAGAALALPALDIMLNENGTAHADGTALPRRFGVFYWGNGVRPDRWHPNTTGTGWELTDELAPFAPVRDYVSVVTGLEVKAREGSAHHKGRGAMLCAAYDTARGTYGGPDGPSTDYVVSRAFAGQATFDAIQTGISIRGKSNSRSSGTCSFDDTGARISPEYDPVTLWERLFAGGLADIGDAAHVAAVRRSVLDVVREDAASLRLRLGAHDRVRLEAHLEGVNAIERAIADYGRVCEAPARPGAIASDPSHELLEEKTQLMSDLLAMALACDLTRVFTMEFTGMQADTLIWQVGATEGVHVMTHDDRADTATPGLAQPERVHDATTFTMARLSDLLQAFAGVSEGDGTLLDNTCVYATSEVNDGTRHNYNDMPILICGRAGGALRSGIHYRSTTEESATRAMLTCMRAVGVDIAEYGKRECYETEHLGALMV